MTYGLVYLTGINGRDKGDIHSTHDSKEEAEAKIVQMHMQDFMAVVDMTQRERMIHVMVIKGNRDYRKEWKAPNNKGE
jgi:hypothetical protein